LIKFISENANVNATIEENKTLSTQNQKLKVEIENLKRQINNSENRHKETVEGTV